MEILHGEREGIPTPLPKRKSTKVKSEVKEEDKGKDRIGKRVARLNIDTTHNERSAAKQRSKRLAGHIVSYDK